MIGKRVDFGWRCSSGDNRPERAGRILLVDDDPIVLYGLSMLLKGKGYEVAKCADGAQALDAVDREDWDLVVLDLGLPSPNPKRVARFDGIKVLEWMTRLHREIPVLVFTGSKDPAIASDAVAAGAVALVRKSDPIDCLLQAVRLALAHRMATRSSLANGSSVVFQRSAWA